MYGRQDLHEIDPEEFSDDETDFHSILEYLDNEATRSKVLITSTKQGKVVNEFCLQAHAALLDKGSHFTMVIELMMFLLSYVQIMNRITAMIALDIKMSECRVTTQMR